MSPQIIFAILFLGIGSNVLFYYLYFIALRILKTTYVTNLISVSPFLTLVFASLLLGEQIHLYYITIAAFAAIGILIQRLDRTGGTYIAKKHSKLKHFLIFDVTGAFASNGELAISKAIGNGGRVLALKLDGKHEDIVKKLVGDGGHENVFTNRHPAVTNEIDFVKEVLGAQNGDLVVMKAGDVEDGERFFEALSGAIEEV